MPRIIAVIPARAGSKGVPNKNIRILNGRPLITYVIENAIFSKYIDKVIVSSDSDKVLSIAKRMGAEPLKRDDKLCKDDVTLDAVIYDAVRDEDCDFVVTMQPTSPTLTTKTLDNAIGYILNSDLDTLISCVNDPRLSWKREDNGGVYPAYEARVNRQYMKPEYVETGAFFITKRKFVTENSRLGKNISVFEIPESESIDIDTFNDMALVDIIMKRKKVAFFVNGNSMMGTGHVQRVLTLSDEFDSKPDIYYDINSYDELINIISDHHYDILINDTLDTDVDYMKTIRAKNPKMKIINFDDIGDGAQIADFVINPFYEGEKKKKVKYGERYFILNGVYRLFEPIEIQGNVQNVFICFGGADPADYTRQIAEIITDDKYKSYNFTVIMGGAYRHASEVKALCEENENVFVYQRVSNIYDYMLDSDVAISSRGITGYELGALGIPTMTLSENEVEDHHTFLGDENGYKYVGRGLSSDELEKKLKELLGSSKEKRQEMQKKMLDCDLRNGTSRVKEIIDHIGRN